MSKPGDASDDPTHALVMTKHYLPPQFLSWLKLLFCPGVRSPCTELLRITTLGIAVNSKMCYLHTEVLNERAFLFPVVVTGGLMVIELSSALCQVYFPKEISE